MKKLLLLSLLFVAGTVSSADAVCASDSSVVIYYGNGMFISPARARVQALMMDKKIRPALPTGTKVVFSYAYNNSEDDMTQLLQVAGQAVDDKSIKVPSWVKVPSGAPAAVRNAIRSAEQAASVENYVKDQDLTAHVARYSADLAAGKRVIVLAHSQGNFYANSAYERLSSKSGFGIVAIATPASFTAGDGPYTTLTNDQVITPIPGRRAPNTSNGTAFVNATASTDGHSFTGIYLNGDVSGPQIVTQVKSRLASLACPVTP